jgi:hypothetical protein
MFGLEFSDRVALARQGELLATREPGSGPQAMALAQWLAEVWPAGESRELWVATGAGIDAAAMGELLRVLRAAQFNVQGFVDSVAAVAGWQRLPGHSIAAQLDGPQLLISVVSNDGHATELQRTVRLAGGSARLHDAWLRLAAQTLVQQTRFDPLHDRHQESALRDALPALAESAVRDGQGQYTIQFAGQTLALVLTRDQLAQAAQPILQPAALALQTLSAGMPDAALLVGESLAGVPGADAMLEAARVARALRLSAGSAARAASLLAPAPTLASGAVQYLTRVPNPVIADGADSKPPVLLPALQTRETGGVMATHLIYRGRAVPIGHEALVIGRDPAAPLELRLPDGIAGLSRRHCTLRRERGRALLIDHSSHGSYIDGIRVRGRAFLAAGSVLRLGTPGIDLQLVALDAGGAET